MCAVYSVGLDGVDYLATSDPSKIKPDGRPGMVRQTVNDDIAYPMMLPPSGGD